MEKKLIFIVLAVVIGGLCCCVCAIAAFFLFNRPINLSPTSTDFQIKLERGPCFGFCPIYTVVVDQSGIVTLIKNKDTDKEEQVTYTVAPGNAKLLLDQANKMDFFNLNSEYRDPFITDLPDARVTIIYMGKTKSIYMYGLEDTVPPQLTDLTKKIDEYLEVDEHLPSTQPL